MEQFEIVIRRLRPQLVASALKRLGSRYYDDGQDIVQNAIVYLLPRSFNDEDHLRNAAFLAVKSYAANWRRLKKFVSTTTEADEPEFVILDNAPLVSEQVEKIESREELDARIRLLNYTHRTSLGRLERGAKGTTKALHDEAGRVLSAQDDWIERNWKNSPSVGRSLMKSLVYHRAIGSTPAVMVALLRVKDELLLMELIAEHRDLIDACLTLEGDCKRDQFIDAAYRRAAARQLEWLKTKGKATAAALHANRMYGRPYIPKPDGIARMRRGTPPEEIA